MKIKRRVPVFSLIVFLSLSLASAEIIISQPKTLYNFGDSLDVSINIIPSKDTRNFFTVALICPNEELELYRNPFNLNTGETREVSISVILDKLITSQGGKCSLTADFGDETASSQSFELLSAIKVEFDIESISYNPGEEIKSTGKATKFNSEPLDGYVELSIPELDVVLVRPVQNGNFNFNFSTPNNAMSGDYKANIKAYEKNEFGEIIDEGSSSADFRIKQVMNELDIALTTQKVLPNNEVSYTPVTYDQAGDKIESDVAITVYDPEGIIFAKNLARLDQTLSLFIGSNYTPGSWRIEASSGNFKKTREFVVEEYKNITFSLVNNTLIVGNTGNVPFEGPLEILIGGIKEIKDLSLDMGKNKKFKLQAPDGDYEIKIGDNIGEHIIGTTFLTGRAISVDDFTGDSAGNFLIILWLIIIVIIMVIVVLLYKKLSRKTYVGKTPSTSNSPQSSKVLPMKKADTSNVIDKGEKQECSIVALKIKNISELKSNQEALNSIENALVKVKEIGGRVYSDGEIKIVILAPPFTKSGDNTMNAIKSAMLLEKMFKEYNSKSLRKIDYGIGLNIGSLIIESKDNKFKFVASDNSIISVKNIAQFSNNDILLSEVFHRKTIGRAKAKKLSDKNLWQLDRVPDRSQHNEFINKFKKRNPVSSKNNFKSDRKPQ